MLSYALRLLAFFMKEFNEVRRQPNLILSLILGPFLILLLVGLGYAGNRPPLQIALVVPEALESEPQIDQAITFMEENYDLVYVGNDLGEASDLLDSGQVEVIQIIPEDLNENIEAGEQSTIEFTYDTLDPQDERFLRFSTYTQVEELNQLLLRENIESVQQDADGLAADIGGARMALEAADGGSEDTSEQLSQASQALAFLAANPVLLSGTDEDPEDMQQLSDDLDALSEASDNGELDDNESEVDSTIERMRALEEALETVEDTPSIVIVSPLDREYNNQSGGVLGLMVFFAPAVVAFILQHIAVTFGALSLVRERLRGATEFFGVAPVSMFQVLTGKYFAYLLFTGLIAAGLTTLLITVLEVPFTGNIVIYIVYVLLFLVASLGIGFLISVISQSDTQAVQLAMLVLLLSVFFSGFILPLNFYRGWVKYVGYIVPVTHAQQGFRDIMLSGSLPPQAGLIAMAVICLITLSSVSIIWRQQFRTKTQ